jgi:hypothetical protein
MNNVEKIQHGEQVLLKKEEDVLDLLKQLVWRKINFIVLDVEGYYRIDSVVLASASYEPED